MKFLDIVQHRISTLQEQVPVEPAAPAPTPAVAPEPTLPAPLSPEGEVFLVRLLRKALFMNPGDLDEKSLKELPEINETNAADTLNKIIDIMKKYSSNIDVETA
jgi:hypothetical protein